MSEAFRWFYTPFFHFIQWIDLYGQTAAKGDFEGYGGGLGFLFLLYNFILLILLAIVIATIIRIFSRRR